MTPKARALLVAGLLIGTAIASIPILRAPLGDFWSWPAHWYELATVVAALMQAAFAAFVLEGLRQARRSADAAGETLRYGQQTAERQLRAYISYERSIVSLPTVGEQLRIRVELMNRGQTPARNVCAWGWSFACPSGQEPNFERPAELISPSRADLGPGRLFGVHPWSDVLDAKMVSSLTKGEVKLYACGEITYDDVFGNSRTTAFRLQYISNAHLTEDRRMFHCDGGNESN